MGTPPEFHEWPVITSTIKSTSMSKSNECRVWFVASRLNDLNDSTF